MATRVYSTRFLIGSGINFLEFECPVGFVAVLKDITVCSTTTLEPVPYGVYHQPSNVTIVTGLIPPRDPLETQRSETYETRFVFYPGELIKADLQAFTDLTASGYMLQVS